jgi:hypothetical protein
MLPQKSLTLPDIRDFLDELQATGITVTLAEGGRLRCAYDNDALDDTVREELRRRKQDIIAALTEIEVIGRVRNWLPHSLPEFLTIIRHNQLGVNQYGESAATHPYAIINLPVWREWPWDLTKCHWFKDEWDMSCCGYEPLVKIRRKAAA